MTLFTNIREKLGQVRAARRAGYSIGQVYFGATLSDDGQLAWDGTMFERATHHEICPITLHPCDLSAADAQGTSTITFFEKNTGIPLGTALCLQGETA